MRKKMFIRNVPEDLWEEIDAYCRRRGYKRRDFLAHAMAVMRGPGDVREEKKSAELSELKAKLKAYEDMVQLARRIKKVRDEVHNLGDSETEDNARLEIIEMEKTLNMLIKEWVPKHEIPEDREERKKLGLPEKLHILPPGMTFEDRFGVSKEEYNYDDERILEEIQKMKDDINGIRQDTSEANSENEDVDPVKAD